MKINYVMGDSKLIKFVYVKKAEFCCKNIKKANVDNVIFSINKFI